MTSGREALSAPAAPEDRGGNLLTIVTTCKGRLDHLKQTLPAMVATGLPVVLVDYDCPDGARHYAAKEFPGVTVVAVDGRSVFNLAAARNLGAAAVRSAFIFFCDCDARIEQAFSDAWGERALATEKFLVAGNGELHGQCIVAKSAFDRVGGYDEVITGWGGEDGDFYLRLQAGGLTREALPGGLLTTLRHPDRDRAAFTGASDTKMTHRLNVAYATIKRDVEALSGARLSLEQRGAIRALVVDAFDAAASTNRPGIVTWSVPVDLGPVAHLFDGASTHRLKRELRYEIAPVSASRFSRLAAAIRDGRILSGLRRRMSARKGVPR